jgi:hypothetical protein
MLMPPAFVTTIREEIFYEYAKLISRSAYGSLQRGFITDRFKKLRDGEISISGTMREWGRLLLPFVKGGGEGYKKGIFHDGGRHPRNFKRRNYCFVQDMFFTQGL